MQADPYISLTEALATVGLTAQQSRPDQLIVSAQQGPVWPNTGNSFWLSHNQGTWYLSTWLPAWMSAGLDPFWPIEFAELTWIVALDSYTRALRDVIRIARPMATARLATMSHLPRHSTVVKRWSGTDVPFTPVSQALRAGA